ncbi:MAG: site-2 protease family protein [Gammaproteobacteria bacterium]
MIELSLVQKIIVCVPPILLAVTLHEVAHGWVAKINGDRTAELMGRLSVNPIKHVDPVGTILLPAFLAFTTGFIFGWAKPVPVSFNDLNSPKTDMAKVAIAGPASNMVMMIIWAVVLKMSIIAPNSSQWITVPLIYMASVGVYINCIMMVLNLLPLPPLDGSRILAAYLPGPLDFKYMKLERYGIFILLALLVFTPLGGLMLSSVQSVVKLFSEFTGTDINGVVQLLFSKK